MTSIKLDEFTIIGYQDWRHAEDNGMNHRDLHFTVELAKMPTVRRVLFVNRPVSFADQLFRRKKWKSEVGDLIESGFGYRLYKVPGFNSLYALSTRVPDLITPVLLGRLWWNKAFKKKSIIRRIATAKKKLGISDGVLMLCTPFAISAIDTIPHKFLAFDVIDNFAKHLQLRKSERKFCSRAYNRIDASAKLISCVTAESAELFGNQAATVIIRNGVDKSWMALAPPKPPDLERFKNRIAGFGGTFTKKFNGTFLAEVARLLPEVDFVLMGKVLDPDFLRPFDGIPNVHYIGFRDFGSLPAYYYHFDAGLILYHRKKEHDGDPLKLYEYLSLGTPVVTLSAQWALKRFDGVLFSSDTPAQFAGLMRSIFETDRQEWRIGCRRKILDEDFWENKAKTILREIGSRIDGSQATTSAVSLLAKD